MFLKYFEIASSFRSELMEVTSHLVVLVNSDLLSYHCAVKIVIQALVFSRFDGVFGCNYLHYR